MTTRPVTVDWAAWGADTFSYVDVSSIDNDRAAVGAAKRLPVTAAPSRARQVIAAGDVLFATVRPYLRNIAAVTADLSGQIASTAFCVLRPKTDVLPSFLFLWVLTDEFVRTVTSQQRGVSYPAVTDSQVRDLMMPVPPVGQQHRIAMAIEEEFSRIDSGDLSLSRVAARLGDMDRALIADAIRGAVRPLSSVLSEPLRNGHSAPRTSSEGGVRTLTLTAVTNGDFSSVNTKLTSADRARVKDLWLRQGDILIERSNTPELVGTARMYRGPNEFAIFPDLLIRARVNPDHDPEYLELVLQSAGLRQYFKSRARGISGSMPKIDQRTIETAPVAIPTLSEQREIVERHTESARAVRRLEDEVRRGQRKARRLRQSVLAAAFSGQLTHVLAGAVP